MVRCGISLYGIDPDVALAGMVDLRPALTLRSEVSFVKSIEAGEAVGYGHRWRPQNQRLWRPCRSGMAMVCAETLGCEAERC